MTSSIIHWRHCGLHKLANGVSQLHGHVSRAMWSKYENICPIISITNAQNWRYWADKQLYQFHGSRR